MSEAAPADAPAPETAPEPVPRGRRARSRPGGFWRHWRRLTLLPLAGLVLLLAAALAALWIWAGTEGSLATALRWAGHWTALTAQGVRGDIRHGGTARRLAWSDNGLHVQVRDARIA
ncbi:MAG: hypothetical protein LBU72_03305, partial [Burkholderiaceae bacterium]|nr:hypothetical protein [Burkholderiaceae bacterium]